LPDVRWLTRHSPAPVPVMCQCNALNFLNCAGVSTFPERSHGVAIMRACGTDKLRAAVLRVGDGRGFVVERRGCLNREERIVITAAHCLAYSRLANGIEGLPPSHPGRYLEEETYRDLLGRLGVKPTVWAACLFVDPIADIAVLGPPDNQDLSEQADSYDRLLEGMATLVVADAPAQGTEPLTFGDHRVENPTPGEGLARVLSLKGRWREGRVTRRGGWLAFEPGEFFVNGMSGSPIVDANGAAIGVVSTSRSCPVILDSLSTQLVRSIVAVSGAIGAPA
jgi:hypothetical protein